MRDRDGKPGREDRQQSRGWQIEQARQQLVDRISHIHVQISLEECLGSKTH